MSKVKPTFAVLTKGGVLERWFKTDYKITKVKDEGHGRYSALLTPKRKKTANARRVQGPSAKRNRSKARR